MTSFMHFLCEQFLLLKNWQRIKCKVQIKKPNAELVIKYSLRQGKSIVIINQHKSDAFPHLNLQLIISRSLIPTHHLKVYHPVVFVCFMSSSSLRMPQKKFQTCANKSISCRNLVFLHPVFRHYVSDLWCDQSLTRFEVSVMIFILYFDFCLILFWIWGWQQWV